MKKSKLKGLRVEKRACCRLKAMGLFPGEEVEIVSSHRGPVVLNVKGFRLALGCGMAQKILVSIV